MAAILAYKYTGGAANANPDLSLGGDGSSVTLLTTALNNLFDNVYPTDILVAQHKSYRAIDLYNAGDNSALHIEFWFTDTPNDESVLHAWYEAAPGQIIVNDTTEPAGALWFQYTDASRLALPNLAAGSRHRIWIRRTVDQSAENLNDDTAIMHCWYS